MLKSKRGQEGGPNKAIVGMLILIVFLVVMVGWEPKAFASVKKVTDKVIGLAPKIKIGEEKLTEEKAIPADVRRAYEGLVRAFSSPPAAYYCTVGINSFESDKYWIDINDAGSGKIKIELWTIGTSIPFKEAEVSGNVCGVNEKLIDNYKDSLGNYKPLFLGDTFYSSTTKPGFTSVVLGANDPIKLFAYEGGSLCLFSEGFDISLVVDKDCIGRIDDAQDSCKQVSYPKCSDVYGLSEEELILPGLPNPGVQEPLQKLFYGKGWRTSVAGYRESIVAKDLVSALDIVEDTRLRFKDFDYVKESGVWKEKTSGKIVSSRELAGIIIGKLPKIPISINEIKRKAAFEAADDIKDYINNIDPREIDLASGNFNKAKQILNVGKENGKSYEQIIEEVSQRNGIDLVLVKSIITHESLTTSDIQRCVSVNLIDNNCVLHIRSIAKSNGISQVKDETITDLKKRGLAPECDFYSSIECQVEFGVAVFKDKFRLAEQYISLDELPDVADCCTKEDSVIKYSCGGFTEEYRSAIVMAVRAYNGVSCGGQPDVDYVRNVLKYYPYYAPPALA